MPQFIDLPNELLLKILRLAAPAPVLRFCYPHIATAPADYDTDTHNHPRDVLHDPYLDLSLVCHRISGMLEAIRQPITMHFCSAGCAIVGLQRWQHPTGSSISRIKIKSHFKRWDQEDDNAGRRIRSHVLDVNKSSLQYSLKGWKVYGIKWWNCDEPLMDYTCKGKAIFTMAKSKKWDEIANAVRGDAEVSEDDC